jgi:hypothetical protein
MLRSIWKLESSSVSAAHRAGQQAQQQAQAAADGEAGEGARPR